MTGSRYSLSESIQIEVPGSTPMPTYLARPDSAESRGTVIVGMELFGVTAHVRDVCDRLAAHGYAAIAPDFYHRSAPGIELAADEHGRERGFELLQQLTRPQALDDLAATVEWIAINRAPLTGIVGLSLGGHLAYLAATHFALPDVSIFYGGWIPTADIDHQLIEYPGVGHGFLCDRRPSFHPEAANDASNRLLRFLAQSRPARPPGQRSGHGEAAIAHVGLDGRFDLFEHGVGGWLTGR